MELRLLSTEPERRIFAARTEEIGTQGDGSGGPAAGLDDEIRSAQERFDAEEAAWFVAVDGDEKVGMVFGELEGHAPDFLAENLATASLNHICG